MLMEDEWGLFTLLEKFSVSSQTFRPNVSFTVSKLDMARKESVVHVLQYEVNLTVFEGL